MSCLAGRMTLPGTPAPAGAAEVLRQPAHQVSPRAKTWWTVRAAIRWVIVIPLVTVVLAVIPDVPWYAAHRDLPDGNTHLLAVADHGGVLRAHVQQGAQRRGGGQQPRFRQDRDHQQHVQVHVVFGRTFLAFIRSSSARRRGRA